jgi:decaprenyl-phosphate phosphoribosyltransferase
MNKYPYYILKLIRPRQWIKNLALFAAPTFGGQLFTESVFTQIFWGFLAFCLLASATYIVNDLLDVQKDKLHPFKKLRPIASGKISSNQAIGIFLMLILTSLFISWQISVLFFLIAIFYLILQFSYSIAFKSLAVFDILFIASGYILRVLAGEVISGYHISVWLLLTTVSLSLFLAVGKRRSELTLLRNATGANIAAVRKTLSHYSDSLLDAYSMIFATVTFVFYSMFTFLESTRGISVPEIFLPEFLPSYFQRKWLMITILPVIYGIMRYLQDIYEKSEGESPERVLLSDKSLLSAVIIWAFLVVFVIYVIG